MSSRRPNTSQSWNGQWQDGSGVMINGNVGTYNHGYPVPPSHELAPRRSYLQTSDPERAGEPGPEEDESVPEFAYVRRRSSHRPQVQPRYPHDPQGYENSHGNQMALGRLPYASTQPASRPSTSTYTSSVGRGATRRLADYTVAWICALAKPEWKASRLLFDEVHEDLPLPQTARSQYVFGTMNRHDVVMVCLPVEQIGEASAAATLAEMIGLFPNLRFALLVGVGGGVWSEDNDVRLGDVVIGQPSRTDRHGGVIRYDYGKAVHRGEIQLMGSLPQPQPLVLTALAKVLSQDGYGRFNTYMDVFARYRDPMTRKSVYARPQDSDRLYKARYAHSDDKMRCRDICASVGEVLREDREDPESSQWHYGLIASGDQVMKDAVKRDHIVNLLGGKVLCFEMEAGGMVGQFSCLVVRGICDYCDSHKNKEWQPYAAAAAASWAKEFLRNISPVEARQGDRITGAR